MNTKPLEWYQNNKSTFEDLSYSEEVKIRSEVFKEAIKDDEEFKNFEPNEREYAAKKFIFQPPELKNKEVESAISNLGQSYIQGDKKAAETIKDYFGAKAFGSSFIGSGLIGFTDTVIDALGGKKVFGNSAMVGELFLGDDARKVTQYFTTLLNEDEQNSEYAKNMGMAAGVAGTLTDFLVAGFGSAAAGKAIGRIIPSMANVFKGGTLGRSLAGAIGTKAAANTTSRVGTVAARYGLPALGETVEEGIFNVFRHMGIAALDGDEAALRQARQIDNVAKNFGEGAAIDYAINFSLGVLGPIGKQVGNVFRKKTRVNMNKFESARSLGELQEMSRNYFEGNMSKARFKDLDQATKDHLTGASQAQKYAEMSANEIARSPLGQSTISASGAGYHLIPESDGYKLTKIFEPDTAKKFNSIREVNDEISKLYSDAVSKIDDPKAKEYLEQAREFTYNFKRLGDDIDSDFNPLSKLEEGTEEYKKVRQAIKKKSFIPATNRPRINSFEARSASEATTGRAHRFNLEEDPSGRVLIKSEDPNGQFFAITKNTAPKVEYDAALARVRQMPERVRMVEPETKLAENELIKRGYDSAIIDDAGTTEHFFPKRVKLIDDKISSKSGREVSSDKRLKVDKSSDITEYTSVKGKSTAWISVEDLPGSEKAITDAVFDAASDPLKLKKITKSFLKRSEDAPKNISIRPSSTIEKLQVSKTQDGLQFKVPRNLDTPAKRQQFVKDYLGEMSKRTNVGDADFGSIVDESAKRFEVPGGTLLSKEDWFEKTLQISGGKLQKTESGYRAAVNLGGEVRTFEGRSINDVADEFYLQNIDPSQARAMLADEGYNLIQRAEDFAVKGRSNKELFSARTIPELFRQMNFRPDKVDIRFGPKLAFINESGAKFELTQTGISGSPEEVRRFLDNFEDYSRLDKMTTNTANAEGKMLKRSDNNYEVRIDSAGIIRQFDDPKEARKFLEGSWKEITQLETAFSRKGLKLRTEGTGYRVTGVGINIRANNLEELKEVSKRFPDPSGAPELVPPKIWKDIEETIAQGSFGRKMAPAKPLTWTEFPQPTTEISPWRSISMKWEPFMDWISKASKQSGHPQIASLARRLGDRYRDASVAISEGDNIITRALTEGKKNIPIKRRRGLYHLLEEGGPSTEGGKKAIKDYGLTSEDLNRYDFIKEFFEKLKFKFGIDPEKWIKNYAPRVRQYAEVNKMREISDADMEEFTNQLFGSSSDNYVPKEFSFFAEHERVSEIVRFAQDDDMLSVMVRYNSQGHKKLYMNETWKELNDYLSKNMNSVPDEILQRTNMFRSDIMGHTITDAEKTIRNFGRRFFGTLGKKLGKDSEAWSRAGQDILQHMMSINYSTLLGFRPFLPIRNLFQVYSTLGPRFGNEVTNEALRRTRNISNARAEYLRSVGILQTDTPVVFKYSGTENPTGNITDKALKWFSTSDDITRAISFETASIQYRDALKKLQAGKVSYDQFEKLAGINLVAPEEVPRIMDQVKKGNYDTAEVLFGRNVTEETMFLYERFNQPTAFRGVIGRLFGQYGTHTTNYIQNTLKGLGRGTTSQRVAFASRWMANGAAMYAGFAALGIEAESLLPWAPLTFTGGPMFDLSVAAVRSTGQGYQANQARAELTSQLKYLWPGNYQYRAIRDFIKYSSDGDLWKASLALSSTPIHPEIE